MKTNRYGNPSKAVVCPKCDSTKVEGQIPDFMCLSCGNKFQVYKPRFERELLFRKRGFHKEKKIETKSRLIVSDCPILCPKCQSQNIIKKEEYCQCKSCNYFDKIEFFEAV